MPESLPLFHVKAPQKFLRLPTNMHILLTTCCTKCMPPGRKLFAAREGVGTSIKHWWISFLRWIRSMCCLKMLSVTCLILHGRLSIKFWRKPWNIALLRINEDIFQPLYIALAMCQVPGSPLPYSWYDGISLIGPCRPLFALHADISRKKCDFLQVLSIGHLAYLFSTSFACVLTEHSFTRISNSYQISLQNIYGYQLCSCILSLQHIRLMQLTFDSPKYLMIERQKHQDL